MMSNQLIDNFANIFFLTFVAGIPLYGFFRKVKVYEAFVDGAKDGFQVIIKIIPFIVGMLVAIGMFRASGGFDMLANAIAPALSWIGMPADVLPLALIRPFSGNAANGFLANIIQTHGGNSYISHLAGTIMGSTETTFYVLTVYFGAIGVYRTRYAVPAGITADIVGVLSSVAVCRWLLA
jgi:spore maturation protein B